MIRMYVRHPVEDFAVWKRDYDGNDAARSSRGVVDHAVYQSVDDPNDVTVWHDFETLEAARDFAESPWLRDAMNASGVAGKPTIWFANPV